jgi:uncharacterized protein (DUF58 family)
LSHASQSSRSSSDGLRPTKVGLYFLLLAAVVALAALNTGNNGLFLVVALMLAIAAGSHLLGGLNVRGLRVKAAVEGESFANRPGELLLEVENRGRLPRFLLVVAPGHPEIDSPHARPRRPAALVAYLPAGGRAQLKVEGVFRRRGLMRLDAVHVSSLFPLGLFNKGRRYPLRVEWLVFPEIFARGALLPSHLAGAGDEGTRRRGWGHELLSLRPYQSGDDPRSIHWKQSARQGELISQNREQEEQQRLMIVFDNAVGMLETAEQRKRFEHLISEAATAALDSLGQGTEVGLRTRDLLLPYGGGMRQRYEVLQALALVVAVPWVEEPLRLHDAGSAATGRSRPGQALPRELRFTLALPGREAA